MLYGYVVSIETAWVKWSATDPDTVVRAEPDLQLPRYATIEVRDEPGVRFDLDLKVFYDPSTRRYTLDSMTILKRPQWDSTIDSSTVRDIKVQEYLRRGLSDLAWIETTDGTPIPSRLTDEQATAIRKAGPSSDDTLRWVARLYTRAWALHVPPAQEVQDQLKLTRPTTSVWLRRARDRGLLTDPLGKDAPAGKHSEDSYKAARLAQDVLRG